ncbi:hypothetical protein [Prescottella agglutinans]|uniref:Uncharacterized protein n=1 Tax=Prescottella agglutinans TaxID=1644129 RepID=A0ABT6MJP8_9NOCA|nr:hypothetical protein [Prescottella agglutinans]MDH6284546.1 hypothetical protein [Prescottella agglutinans]
MNTPSSSHENTETAGGNTANARDDDGADPGICPWCTAPIPPLSRRGRPRVWCSDQCRRDAHNARKAARAGAVGMQVIRQTRTIEKPVPVPVVEYRDPHPTATPARYLDDHDIAMHVLRNPDLLAKILDSFSAGLGPRLTGRQLTGPLHEAALRLAPRLDDYRRHATPPPPEPAASRADTAGLSRQQRRALERLEAKKPHR